MRELLLEHPLMLAVGGAALVGLAVFVWVQTAMRAALYTGLALAALTAVLVTISLQVVTDRERITRTLHEVAVALERNDHQTVFDTIHPNAVQAVQRARGELPRYTFSEARVTRVREILVNSETTPPTATAEFTVFVDVALQGMQYRGPRLIKVYFMKEGDHWLVRDYEHSSPLGPRAENQRRLPE